MSSNREIVTKSIILAFSACISAFSSGMLLNNFLRNSSFIVFIPLFVFVFIILFELVYFICSALLRKISYFYSLNSRIIGLFKKTNAGQFNSINDEEKERLKNLINVKKEDRGKE
ncbi:MAG: hypothetical protein JEY94_04925 [Melioribacteraceae bacterium]|nr:hypothetical protein [Melioribacteraceae bacterium]